MQRWFLSYNSRDFTLVDGLQNALKRKLPDAEIFFAPKTLRAGGYWLPMLADGITQANAFALIVGEKGLGPWQVMEYYEALDRRVKSPDFPVVLVLLQGQPAPGLAFLRQLHWILTPDPGSEETAARLVEAAAGGGSRPSELWRYTSPYRGLAAMTEADSDFFFGRQHETTSVLRSLADSSRRLPILLGNSGVGKSSLAQAGVMAALKRQAFPAGTGDGRWPAAFQDSRRWCSLVLKPGVDPIRALVEPFLDTWQFAATDPERVSRQNGWIELLRNNKATLVDLLDATERRYQELNEAKPPAFFIYVDQGEELYARSEETQRQRFSALLAEALADERLHALMSMRSDFLGALQNDPPLYSVHEKVDVPPLRETELREAVSQPAELLSARFETDALAADIAQRTAEESIKDAGALPLLSYLLDDMWTQMIKRGDGMLRLPPQAMELGGVLASRANAFLARYPKLEETLRRVLTLKLATVREDGEPTRRLARRSEFTAEEWRLVSELADHPHRLLVVVTPELGETYAEVAHEAIFRRWDKLREWITAEREFLVWKSKLEAARRAWQQSPENSRDDALLMGLSLAQAQSWLSRRGQDLADVDRDFIHRSFEQELLERRQRESLRRRVFWTAVAALVVVSVLAAFSFFEWRNALSQKVEALRQQHLAQRERDRAQHAVSNFLLRMLMVGLPSGESAIAELDEAIRRDPSDVTSYFLRATLYFQKGDWDRVIADLNEVIKLDPGNIPAYLSRATAHENKGDYDAAIADIDAILKLNPRSSVAYNARGYAYYGKRNYDHAVADYDRAIALNPRFSLAFDNRGNAYFAKKDYDRALADYGRAIEIDPNNPKSYFWYENRGNTYFAKGDFDRAIADLTAAIRHNPGYAAAYNSRGNAYFYKKDYARAEADYSAAIRIAPSDRYASIWHWNRGNVYLLRFDYERALADYDEAIRMAPKFAAAYSKRCWARVAVNKDVPQALQDCDVALGLVPGDAPTLESRAFAHLRLGEFAKAIADFDAALKVNPKLAGSFYGRGLAKLKSGDRNGAEADFVAAKAIRSGIESELVRLGFTL